MVCDSRGIISPDRQDLAGHKARLAASTNPRAVHGRLGVALGGADVFVGVSGGQVPEDEIASMAPGAMVFALANPTPEVHPDVARRHAAVVATGRSDFPNQINNVLAFPGIFRGALDAGAPQVTEAMKLAAAHAIADLVAEPSVDCDRAVACSRRASPRRWRPRFAPSPRVPAGSDPRRPDRPGLQPALEG